jgi:hypothetical protein
LSVGFTCGHLPRRCHPSYAVSTFCRVRTFTLWTHEYLQASHNVAERELRLPVRLRDAAPMFRSKIGALVAAEIWTFLVTALLNGVNAFKYLNAVQRHADDVRREPMAWLPWNYEVRADQLDPAPMAAARVTRTARNRSAPHL